MSLGLCNGPATYARVINLLLRGLNWKTVRDFLDDILVLGKNFKDLLSNLGEALARLRRFGLRLKPKKCVLFQRQVKFLGRNVSQNNIFRPMWTLRLLLIGLPLVVQKSRGLLV